MKQEVINMTSPKLDRKINIKTIDKRFYNCLRRNGICHIYTLTMMTENQIHSLRGIGEKGFMQIYTFMESNIGIPLCESIKESKERYNERYGDKYIKTNIFDYAKNPRISIKQDKKGSISIVNFDETIIDTVTSEQLLILFNWRNKYTWKSNIIFGNCRVETMLYI